MYLLVLVIPLINFLILSFFGRLLGLKFIILITFNLFFLLLLVFNLFYEVIFLNTQCFILTNNWITTSCLTLNWTFLFDRLSVIMLFLIILISSLVHFYSFEYMRNDPHLIRFISYLSLFTFFMLILVTSGNFIQLFVGWEGVGLSSYLLINFWYTRTQANKSAIKAIIVNRFGDAGIYLAILVIFFCFKSFDFGVVFSSIIKFTEINDFLLIDIIALFLVLGAVGKSAQVGLHTWLPDAMEGPTPVSALIHAATMVTAGVFVILRCSPIIEISKSALFLISFIGALTAIFAGTAGLLQNDIKKIIAYSTCSQLGYMFFACGSSGYSIALFHLFNHGFFKALLFLGAGSIIHAVFDEQDIRKLGSLLNFLPVTYVAILSGSLSLIGFPFTTGFYSKEFILSMSFSDIPVISFFPTIIGILVAGITTFYSLRLIFYTFYNFANSHRLVVLNSYESNSFIFYSLIFLSFITVFVGFFLEDLFIGLGTDLLSTSTFQITNIVYLDAAFLPWYHKFTALFILFFSLFLGFLVFYNLTVYKKLIILLELNLILLNSYWFFIKKWYFDLIYNLFVFKLLWFFYHITFKLVDRGLIELFGPLGISRILSLLSSIFSSFHSGYIYIYIFIILLSIMLLIFFLFKFIVSLTVIIYIITLFILII